MHSSTHGFLKTIGFYNKIFKYIIKIYNYCKINIDDINVNVYLIVNI